MRTIRFVKISLSLFLIAFLIWGCMEEEINRPLIETMDRFDRIQFTNNKENSLLVITLFDKVSGDGIYEYEVHDCKIRNIVSVAHQEVFFYYKYDTLLPGESRVYDVRLFSDTTAPYDSQVVQSFNFFDLSKRAAGFGYEETVIQAYIISYRDQEGRIQLAYLGEDTPSRKEKSFNFNICTGKIEDQ